MPNSSRRSRTTSAAVVACTSLECVALALMTSACALPRERVETLGAPEPADAAGVPGDRDADTEPATSMPATGAPHDGASAAGANAAGATTPAQSGGAGIPSAGAGATPSDAGVSAAASDQTDCGLELAGCLLFDPVDVEGCARKYCTLLLDSDGHLLVSAADGGTTSPSSECAMMLADCIARDPGKTAECMAMSATCMP